jgi:hypothetical protein
MVRLGHQVNSMNTARIRFSRSRSSKLQQLAFGGASPTGIVATEEWTGAGAPTTKTITVS